jgi:hypothetical protein
VTQHQVLNLAPRQLLPTTIAVMAKGAREAANMYAMREWAARLATKAPQRDYTGQLRALFDEIMRRWRYVMEPGEWVHGTGESLVRHVLGTKYNGDPNLDKTGLSAIPTGQKGWGDCDDVSQVVAAGVMALGMTPFFRVVQSPKGGHVSVVARTPRGELVSLDPVGQPEHPFGWMMPAQQNQIAYYDMQARQAPGLGKCDCTKAGATNKTALLRAGRTFKAFPPTKMHYVRSYPGIMPPHVLAVRQGGYLSGDYCTDALSAIDEYKQHWVYNASIDLWEMPQLGALKDIKRRWRKRIKAIRGAVKKVRELHNKIVAKILSNKVGQKLVGTALMAFGVPPGAAPAVMQTAAELIKKGGLIGLLKTLRKSPKAALQLVAAAAKKGLLATGMVPPAAQKYLNGFEGDGMSLVTDINGEVVPVWPVSAIIEVPLGEAEWATATKAPNMAAESKNTTIALAERTTLSRGQEKKSGQTESDWLTNVVLWETYPSSPVKLDPKNKAHKPFIDAWMRINKNVANGLKVQKTSSSSSTPAFAVNTSEGDIARQAVAEKPTKQSHQGSTIAKPPKQASQDWLTDVAYWRAYPDGPTKLDSKVASHKNYINAWRRLAVMVKDALTASTPKTTTPKTTTPKTTTPKTTTPKTTTPKTTTPKTTTPKTTTPSTTPSIPASSNCWEDDIRRQSICQDIVVNPEERAIAIDVVDERPSSESVHGTTVYQGTKNAADWLSNVAYWRAYPEGPIDSPASAGQYSAAWLRINAAVKSALSKASKPKKETPKVEVPKNDLPDLDTREIACLRSGGMWDAGAQMCRSKPVEPNIEPKKETNWLPIVAGAAALLLALKGG